MATLVLEDIMTLVTVAAPENLPSGVSPRRSGAEMNDIGVINDADVVIEDDTIVWIGPTGSKSFPGAQVVNCMGTTILPGFVDSHTHIAFYYHRAKEFAMRLRGATYQEIAAAGGGILASVNSVRIALGQEIAEQTRDFITNAFRTGTTTIEVKSGYGLDVDNEMKLLDVISQLNWEEVPTLVPTFMGAHDFPPKFRDNHEGYISLILDEMLPLVAKKGRAKFCDVFTDDGYFTVEDSERILRAAADLGFELKVHADELTSFGGAELAARVKAVSADHLNHVSEAGIDALKASGTIATLLPATALTLRLPYAPARKMIDRGLPVAIATDCNPGTNMCENMSITLALACLGMGMSIEEAITASTLNGAAALGMSDSIGSIEVGKKADMTIFNLPDYPAIVYHWGKNHVEAMVKNGQVYRWSEYQSVGAGEMTAPR